MSVANRRWLCLLFFLSGFCSLVYQMIWTRLAFAAFGIITPVLSVVLSVFMLGLSVGAWGGGKVIPWLTRKTGLSAIYFYGGAELIIGLGAFLVPRLFAAGEQILLASGETNSFRYLLFSALVLAAAILPWCLCMGATFPWMMAYVREEDPQNTDSFSFLYFANVLGAMMGTMLAVVVFVEVLGFRETLEVAAAGNFLIAALSAWIGAKRRGRARASEPVTPVSTPTAARSSSDGTRSRMILCILFCTGFSAMAMEVVWTRAFTPVLKTQVYSFALIVFTYLGATFAGSLWYRRDLKRAASFPVAGLVAVLAVAAFLPIVAVDPRFVVAHWDPWAGGGGYQNSVKAMFLLLASLCPICGVLGYLTPSLVDRFAAGDPGGAGKAYGVNVVGCIVGPLAASYVLLPKMNERHAIVILCLPLLALAFLLRKSLTLQQGIVAALSGGGALIWCLFFAEDFEGMVAKNEANMTVRRDYAASVISFGEGLNKRLLVNGIGMTILSPITKFMVDLPLAFQTNRPESALIICFGMGTSFRTALSWDIQTTAVELVPDVPETFAFYHADAARVLANPKGRIVIDDGRRFLNRTREKYDLIVVDPPPPVEAAGSSLLYSREFYEEAKEHLRPNGILAAWFPGGPISTWQAVARSLNESFPHVRCFRSVANWGRHFLASMQPIEPATAEELAARMPPAVRQDLMEFEDATNRGPADLLIYINKVIGGEAPISSLLNPDPDVQITDDQPFNEYFLVRQWRDTSSKP